MTDIYHRTPKYGHVKYISIMNVNMINLDDLFLLQIFWFGVRYGFRQQPCIPSTNLAFLEESTDIFVRCNDTVSDRRFTLAGTLQKKGIRI
jgi:hypothetical protein